MTRNAELFEEIAAVIEMWPRTYEQRTFGQGHHTETICFADGTEKAIECGTRMCIAGWAAALSGYTPSVHGARSGWAFVWDPGHTKNDHVTDVAQSALGLTDDEAANLFYGKSRTPDELRRIGAGAIFDESEVLS